MIIGHIGVAFAAKARWRRAPLGWLLAATFAPDIWRTALASAGYHFGVATVYSHTLPWSAVLAVVLASVAWLVFRQGDTAILTALLVASHVGLDLISGWKPLWLGGPTGFDLQHVEQAELALEAVLCWVGWKLLPRGQVPRIVTHPAMMLLLLVGQAAYLSNTYLGRPADRRCITYPFAPCWKKL